MYKKCMKRFIDLFLVILFILPLVVIMLIISFLIKIDSKGKVFFKQERLGRDGQVFQIYKFRTMIENAEKIGTGIFTSDEDPRITKIGHFLRKTSLDELPQIINIVKGEMSFVGPRPPVPYHPYKYEDYDNEKKLRFNMKPGVTGLAQAYGRNTLTWDERIEYDIKYVKKASFLLDCKIIIKTILSVVRKENIYREKEKNEIHLRLFKKSDIDLKVKWINDPDINKFLHYDLPLCPDRTLNWYQSIMSNSSREDYVYEVLDNDIPVQLGLIGLIGIDTKNKKAEFYIINGKKDYWGKGLASQATTDFLQHVFLKHDLNKIYLYTEVDNVSAQKLFEKVGFEKEGLLKEDLIYMGKKIDRYYYGIYREEIISE